MITEIDKKTALVLIDLQNSVVALNTAHPVKAVIENSNKLIAAFRKAGLPVVLVNVKVAGAKWTKARKDAKPNSTNYDDEAFKISGLVATQPDDIYVTKHTWGAFFETPLQQELISRDITGIVLAGVATSIGVEGTARQASELGYNIAFATDAMTDMRADAHEHSINVIFPRIGEVGITDEIINKMAGS